ncbi:MAG: PD-(D/E)XK nuclease family protein, partial [Acutalibacteraceae bacterium]
RNYDITSGEIHIFGKNIKISASKAECFHNCKFMYFCKYGMQAVPRRRAELNPLEYGSVVHYVLEKLLKNHDVSLLSDSAQLNEKIAFYLEEYLNNVMGGSDTKSARFLYLFRRLVETLSVLAIQLSEEFAKSLFRPEAFELPIDGINVQPLKIPLSDGTEISVGGKIDRVDVFRSDGKSYVRVVDYKTGSKEFLLSDILAGLNMQMLIYLDIICGEEASPDTPEPAGVVYSPASIGKVKGVRGETSFDMERREMLKKNGLIMDDSEIINAMEIGMEKKVDKKENANVKGTSTFRSSATYVANKKQFAEIRMYMRKLLKNMGESLHRGEIEASPAKGIYDACAYCDYSVMCTAEQKENGREISKKSMSETMKLIEEDDD